MRYTQQLSHKSWGYVILTALMITGFLLVITVGSFHLVLQEMYDGRGKQNYLKSYAAAEWGLEEALLHIKQKWYGYYQVLDFEEGEILQGDGRKTPQMRYEFFGKTQEHTDTLKPYTLDVIPLFWIDTQGTLYHISQGLTLQANNDVAWNIVASEVGVGGVWRFSSAEKEVDKKTLEETWRFSLQSSTLDAFLGTPDEKYMFIINNSDVEQTYTLKHVWWNEYFTRPRHRILSTGKVGNYRQNIETQIDNTEFLWKLQYSIFWWN